MTHVSLISPCLNEAEVIEPFYARLCSLAACESGRDFEFILVDDGSTDGTGLILDRLADRDPRVRVLHLARNCGHQIALTAGMDFASGDVVVTLDADLQDPPEVVPMLLAKIDEGFDIVHAQRRSREGETWFKRCTARLFYRLLRLISKESPREECGDFRAFTRPVLLAMRGFRERHRYLRGLFAALGFRQAVLPYDRTPRAAGHTKFPLARMIALAVDGILSFSSAPLKSVLWLGCALWAVSLLFIVRACIGHFILHRTVPGWTSLVVLLTFFTGLNLFCLSVIGAYVGKIFEQGQGRPLYWCSRLRNVDFGTLGPEALQTPEVALSRLTADQREAAGHTRNEPA